MKHPIRYTIENIDGKHYVSDSFDVNDNIVLIRLITLHPITGLNDSRPEYLEDSFLINDRLVNVKSFFSPNNNSIIQLDFSINTFLSNTDNVKIELKEKSKIGVQIFTK